MGTEFADYNGDGRLDLVVTNHEFETHSLFRNDGNGLFTDATVEGGLGPATLPHVGFGVVFLDFDNDGQQDLSIVNGHVIDNTAVFRPGSTHAQQAPFRTSPPTVREVAARSGSPRRRRSDAQSGDVDSDGDLTWSSTARRPVLETAAATATPSSCGSWGAEQPGRHRRAQAVTAAARRSARGQVGSSYLARTASARTLPGRRGSRDRVQVRWPQGRRKPSGPGEPG
jgi:hypothetical protein